MQRLSLRLVLVGTLLLAIGACSPAFLLRSGYEQTRILQKRQSISALVADSTTPPELRDRLRLVTEVRDYAATDLRLAAEESYTTYTDLGRDTLLLVLSASPPDHFDSYTWWFPIVGDMPYKGYFDFAHARRDEEKLKARGYDTYLRPSAAFSTLGWFNDPLLSTLLQSRDSVGLAGTVIHELVHNTIYLPGHTDFNESFANFVEADGAMRFFCSRMGPDSESCRKAQSERAGQLRFSGAVEMLTTRLDSLYSRTDLSPEERVSQRDSVLAAVRSDLSGEDIGPGSLLEHLLRGPVNNAMLLGVRRYYHRFDVFDCFLSQSEGDLPRFIEEVVRLASGAEEPYAALGQCASRE